MANYKVSGTEKNVVITTPTGQTYNLNTDNVDTIFSQGTEKASVAAALYYLENKRYPDTDTVIPSWIRDVVNNAETNIWNDLGSIRNSNIVFGDITGYKSETGRNRAADSIRLMIQDNPEIQPAPTVDQGVPGMGNEYYRDLYSLQPGTGGRALFEELAGTFERQSGLAETAATVGFQQQALQQAQVVKQITDQVRAERMARLRAGMSESQIANQDMQQMMTNVNTLNQNAALLNQARLEAQVGQAGARDEAYLEYLKQINERGQVGAAMAASDAGSASQQALEYMRRTGQPYDVSLGAVTNSPVPPKK